MAVYEGNNVPVWDPVKALPGLHSGSWDSAFAAPLLLLAEDPKAYRVITPEEAALLLRA